MQQYTNTMLRMEAGLSLQDSFYYVVMKGARIVAAQANLIIIGKIGGIVSISWLSDSCLSFSGCGHFDEPHYTKAPFCQYTVNGHLQG